MIYFIFIFILCVYRKTLCNLCILEAEKRIGDEEKGDDTSNDKMDNIHPDFIEVLDVLKSHKYCCLFESRLPSQVNLLLIYY